MANRAKSALEKYMEEQQAKGKLLSAADRDENETVFDYLDRALQNTKSKKKSPLEEYMDSQKESGSLLSSADMNEGEDTFDYLDRKITERRERARRDEQDETAKNSIEPEKAAATLKRVTFGRNMPVRTAADEFSGKISFGEANPVVRDIVQDDFDAHKENVKKLHSVRSSDEVRAEIAEMEEHIKKAEKDKFASEFGLLFGNRNLYEQANERLDWLKEEKAKFEQELEESRYAEYELLKEADDFREKSQYKSTKKADVQYNPLSGYNNAYGDTLYDYVNRDEEAGKIIRESTRSGDPFAVLTDMSHIESMTDDEVGIYNYIHATEGAKAAEEYLEFLQSDLYARQRESAEKKFADYAKEHPAKATLGSIALAPYKGLSYVGQTVDTLLTGEADPNAPYNRFTYTPNAIRDTVSQQIEKKWGPVGSFGYQTAMSMADFLTAAGLSGGTGLSLFIMGSGAAADTTISALERGVDSGSALALGAVAGVAEALTEKISIDALFKGDWSKNAIKYVLKNAFSEGGEEVVSDVINTVADVLISGDKSEWEQSVAAYKDEGYSGKEAFMYTFLDKMKEIGIDFLGGALSGAVMSGTGAAINKVGTAAAESDVKFRQFEKLREGLIEDIDARQQKAADAEEGGVMLPTADALGGQTADSEIVSGLDEPKEIRAKTYDETVLDKKIAEAQTASEKSGLRLGVSQERIETAKVLSERTGRDVVFYSDTSEHGKKIDGYYDPSTGNIMLNKDAASGKAVAVVLGHELTHTLEKTQAYADLEEMVFESILREGKNPETEREKIADLYERAGVTLSEEAVNAEIVAKYVEKNLLNNKAAIRELMKTKPSLVRQFRRRLDRIAMSAAGTESLMDMQTLEAALKIYREAEKELMKEEAMAAPADVLSGMADVTAEEADVSEETARSDAAVSGRAAPESKPTPGRGTDAQEKAGSEKIKNASDEPLPSGWDEYLADIEAQYEAGEITEEERDEAYSYVEEARDTGVPFDRASVKIEDIEGKIPAFVREKIVEPIKDKLRFSVSDYSEKDFTYEALTSKPDMKLTDIKKSSGINNTSAMSRSDVVKAALLNVRNKNNPRNTESSAYVRNKDTGIDILVSRNGIEHGLNRKYQKTIPAAVHVGDLIENAVLINRHNPRKGNEEGGVYISAGIDGNDLYLCRIMTDDSSTIEDLEVMYALNAKKESAAHYRLGSGVNLRPNTDSTISIADLLDLVKTYFADSLSHDVLQNMKMVRPKSTVSDSIKYSISNKEPQRLSTFLPTNAMTRLRKSEEAFAKTLANTFVDRETGVRDGDFIEAVKTRLRGISSEYIKYGTSPDGSLDEMFRQYNTAETPEAEAWQFSAFERASKEFQSTLDVVKRFSDSKASSDEPSAKAEREFTTEDAEKMFEAHRNAHRVLDRVKARALLTEEDKLAMGKIRRGEMSLGQLNSSEYNVDDIREVLEAQTAFDEADKQVKLYQKSIKARHLSEAEAALADIADWTDKAQPLAYWRETIDRNFRDIIKDEEKANEFIRHYIKPIHKAEADRQRMLKDYRGRVEALKLKEKPAKGEKVSESYAVQLLGEAEDNIRILEKMRKPDAVRDGRTLDEWKSVVEIMWTENPSLDQAKIRDGVDAFRVIYDELLKQMNEVLLRNGYAPVRYRSGYFPHFTAGSEDSVLAKFGRLFGIRLEVNPLPTSINGLTQDFKPGKAWFSHALERTGFETAYDAVAGFEQYIGGVSDVIHHTDNIQRLRALNSQIRWLSADEGLRQQVQKIENDEELSEEQKQSLKAELFDKGRYRMSNLAVYLDEYTNRLANKKNRIDRGMEQLIGRKAYTVMNNLESRVAANMIGLNIGSALTNIIPLNQAQAVIGPMYTARGVWDTLQNLKDNDGLAAQSDFLASRRGSEKLGLTGVEKVSNIAGMPMEIVDNFVSEAIVRAAYLKNLKSGMSEEAALEDADVVAASLMADRSKGALPLIFDVKNPLAKLLTQFQVEVNNEFSVIFKDIPKAFKEKGLAKLAAVLLQYFFGAKIFNDIYERVLGRRPAFDPLEMVNDAVGGLTGYQLPNVLDIFNAEAWNPGRENPADVITDLGTNALESLPFLGGVLGGGRVPIQSALPDVGSLIDAVSNNTWSARKRFDTLASELLKPASYLVLPTAGGLMKKTIGTVAAALRGGVYGVQDVEVEQDDGTTKIVGEEYLKYPFYKGSAGEFALNFARSLMSGTSTTTGGQEWVESGFKGYTLAETAAYEAMVDEGVDAHEATGLLKSLKGKSTADKRSAIAESDIPDAAKAAVYYAMSATGTDREIIESVDSSGGDSVNTTLALMRMAVIPSGVVSKNAEECRIISEANLDDATAEMLYRRKVTDSDADAIRQAKLTGISFDKYLMVRAEYEKIDASSKDPLAKTAKFDQYIDKAFRNDKQNSLLKSLFTYSATRTSVKNYKALVEAGVGEEHAYSVAAAVEALEPIGEAKSVTSVQKVRAILDSIADDDDRMAAIGAVLSDTEYRRYRTADSFGINADAYTSFRESLVNYDDDGNGSYTQAEIVNAIESLTGAISPEKMIALLMSGQPLPTGTVLTNEQKAVIWQLATGSKSAKNNPYSTSAGNKVIEMLYPKE